MKIKILPDIRIYSENNLVNERLFYVPNMNKNTDI
jgi:hypothetical protein